MLIQNAYQKTLYQQASYQCNSKHQRRNRPSQKRKTISIQYRKAQMFRINFCLNSMAFKNQKSMVAKKNLIA